MHYDICEGPLLPTQRIILPGTGTYVEMRQERTKSGRILYSIEHGSVRWGHRGTWGRNNAVEASSCFSFAVAWNTREDKS